MKKYLIPLVIVLFLGCSEKPEEPIPIDVLPTEKMTKIMVDIQLIEGGITIRKYNKTLKKEQISDYYRALYSKHNVTQKQFDHSMEYYTYHPEKLEVIYDGMMEKLSKMEAEAIHEKADTSTIK